MMIIGFGALVSTFTSSMMHFNAEMKLHKKRDAEIIAYGERVEEANGEDMPPLELTPYTRLPFSPIVKILDSLGVVMFLVFTLGLFVRRDCRTIGFTLLWLAWVIPCMLSGLTD